MLKNARKNASSFERSYLIHFRQTGWFQTRSPALEKDQGYEFKENKGGLGSRTDIKKGFIGRER